MYRRAIDLQEGDMIMINGLPCLVSEVVIIGREADNVVEVIIAGTSYYEGIQLQCFHNDMFEMKIKFEDRT